MTHHTSAAWNSFSPFARTRNATQLPLWLLFPLFFAAVDLSHWTLLRLPYFWDEGGYYIPAALDFFHTGTLVPQSTITNAHPPLPSILLAAWWHIAGTAIINTRTLVALTAAAALLGVYRLARPLAGETTAAITTLLTALYPVWFAQSTLAHADIFAAAFTLWALAFYLEASSNPPPTACHPEQSEGPLYFAAPAPADGRPKDAPLNRPGAPSFAASSQRVGSNWHQAQKPAIVAVLFALAALSKETAIITPLALAAYEAIQALRYRSRQAAIWTLALTGPILPLIAWYAFHFHKTGFIFGNPEFLRYNATANLDPHRIALCLYHRLLHLTAHMNLFVPVACTIAVIVWKGATASPGTPPTDKSGAPAINTPGAPPSAALSPKVGPATETPGAPPPAPQTWPDNRLLPQTVQAIAVILIANWLEYSILGGALLTRYLLPMYPLILLLCVVTWRRRLPQGQSLALAALTAAAFLCGLWINPPYAFAPEDNLTYRDMIVLHQRASAVLEQRFPAATVLTAWPAAAELTRPELGYTSHIFPVTPIPNFSLTEMQKAATDPGSFNTALLFSTKWEPPPGKPNLSPHGGQGTSDPDTRYFDFHHDLRPTEAAQLLHGEVIWQAEKGGEWAAVLHFPRGVQATLMHP